MLDDHTDALDSAWRSFDVCSLRDVYTAYLRGTYLDCMSDRAPNEDGAPGRVRRPLAGTHVVA